MAKLFCLTRRNLALFRSNKMNIMLSVACIPIILGLYILFLRDFLTILVMQGGMDSGPAKEFTDRMIAAGLLVVINTTTCFGIIQICVNDAAEGIRRDFQTAPVSGFTVVSGYWLSGIVISALFTCLTAAAGECYFSLTYGNHLSPETLLHVFLLILFSSCINAGMLLCFAGKLKNTATFSTFANLYGTLAGFLAGAYLPCSFYPKWLKPILFFYPPTQLTSLLRQEYVHDFTAAFEKTMTSNYVSGLYENFGIYLKQNGSLVSVPSQWSVLILSLAVLLFILWAGSLLG